MKELDRLCRLWAKNGMEEASSARFSALHGGENRDGASSRAIVEIMHNLGFEGFFAKKLPPRLSTLDGYDVWKALAVAAPEELKEFQRYSHLYKQHQVAEADRYLYGAEFINISRFYTRLHSADASLTAEAFFTANATLFNRIEGEGCYREKSKIIREIYKIGEEPPLNNAVLFSFLNKAVTAGIVDVKRLAALADGFKLYTRDSQRINKYFVKGLERNIIPAAQKKSDPIFTEIGNYWGLYPFEYGVGDFVFKAATSKVTPSFVNEMMLCCEEFAASDYETFFTNRRDGLTITDTFGTLRDCIHNQRPNVHNLIDAMVAYYDAAPEKREKAARSLRNEVQNMDFGLELENLTDLERYNRVLPRYGEPSVQESAIEVLRRLQTNTRPQVQKLPLSGDQKLDDLATELQNSPDFSREKTTAYFNALNDCMERAMVQKQIGMSPALLRQIRWADRKARDICRRLTFEDQLTAYQQPYFKEIIRFADLTMNASTAYNPQEFAAFYQEVEKACPMEKAYQLIAGRQNLRLGELTVKYKRLAAGSRRSYRMKNKNNSRVYLRKVEDKIFLQYLKRRDLLTSGSLLKELQNFSQYKPATIEASRRLQAEMKRTLSQRLALSKVSEQAKQKGLDLRSAADPLLMARGKPAYSR